MARAPKPFEFRGQWRAQVIPAMRRRTGRASGCWSASRDAALALGRLPVELRRYGPGQPLMHDRVDPAHALAQAQGGGKLVAADEFFEGAVTAAKNGDDFALAQQTDIF